MKVSKRIQVIAGMIANRAIADIGAGDGLLSIYALKAGIIESSVACDVSVGAGVIINRNIGIHGACGIVFRCGFGLDEINKGEAGTIVIAGMGGRTVSEILAAAGERLEGTDQLLLQPQSEQREVRKCVHMLGYRINDEAWLKERGKFYTVMDCRRGEDTVYSEVDYLLGRFRSGDVYFDYLQNEIQAAESIRGHIEAGSGRAQQLSRDLEYRLGVMRECLESRKEG